MYFFQAEQAYKKNPKLLAQLQFCEDQGIPLAVIVGESELERGIVKLREIGSRAETEVERANLVTEIKKALSQAAQTTNHKDI